MEAQNPTTITGIEITDWEENDDRLVIDGEWTKPRSEIEECPNCGADRSSLNKKDRVQRKLHDVRARGKPVLVRLKRMRYYCTACEGTFIPEHEDIYRQKNLTTTLVDRIKRDGLGSYRSTPDSCAKVRCVRFG